MRSKVRPQYTSRYAVDAATTAKTTTEQTATAMNNAHKGTPRRLAAAKKQLEAKPVDAGLNGKWSRQKGVVDATPKAKAATDAPPKP